MKKTNHMKRMPTDCFSQRHPLATVLLLGLLVNLAVETLCRHSLISALRYLITAPHLFVYGALVIAASYAVMYVVPRRGFAAIAVSTVWLGLGIANGILRFYRATPLSFIDLALIPSVWSITFHYLKRWQMIGIALMVLAATALLVMAFRRSQRVRVRLRQALCLPGLLAAVLCVTMLLLDFGLLDGRFDDLVSAYDSNGFVYCFSRSLIDRGVDEPTDYSEDSVEEIMAETTRADQSLCKIRPSIVFVQLESFFDPAHLTGLTLNENPIPVFSQLRDACPSGFLTVPAFGGGTVNTEFEVLTGMSVRDFGTGEYPYHTIMKKIACESISYNLREHGYASHAIHNNTATFYDRNIVFSHLGFDTFTSVEYMNGVEYNPSNWARDDILTAYILTALNSTATPDFIETITVQAHGSYPDDAETEPVEIDYDGFEDESTQDSFAYYLTQLKETDAFIGELVTALAARSEPVILVLYGDHLPNFAITDDMLDNGSIFETEYVIWSNYNLNIPDRDLNAWQLSAYVMDIVGYDTGILTKLHQNYDGNPNYAQALRLLEYDMLYGERAVYGGASPYEPTDLRMGLSEIRLDDATLEDKTLLVRGAGFTKASVVLIDGSRRETIFISSSQLAVEQVKAETGTPVSVAQLSGGVILSETEPVLLRGAT